MLQHRKNDVWGVLEFAAKFSLTRLQASCLATLQHTSRGHLVAAAESVVQVSGCAWHVLTVAAAHGSPKPVRGTTAAHGCA
jgi:hypothetical protein